MNGRDYTPQQALYTLMDKLRKRDARLALQIQAAIDAGKDVEETEPSYDGRKKQRVYRKTAAFTYEEALQIALDALEAYFVEVPLFIESSTENLKKAAIGIPKRQVDRFATGEERDEVKLEAEDAEKNVEVEIQTETRISKTDQETLLLRRTSRNEIDQQEENVQRLQSLISFKEE
jgi:hypothetical protein